jgi:elongation factor Ts
MSTVTITASDVNKLRQQTGAGMMDCRAALQETNGDFEAAIDYLRKKGQKVAAKRSDRDAKEGVVIAKTSADKKSGIVINLTSETDFVAKNEDFINLALSFSETAIKNDCKSLDDLKAAAYDNITVADKIMETVAKIGEKIDITSFERLEGDSVVAYNHAGYRVAVLVSMNKTVMMLSKQQVKMWLCKLLP